MKYTQAEIKKFLEPETRFHMSAHVIQTEAVEMCRQLQAQLVSSAIVIDKFLGCCDCGGKHGDDNEVLELIREFKRC